MKRRIFTIRKEAVIDNVTAFLKSQPLDPLLEVIVQEKEKDRTVAQNRLYRLWGGIIANELGWEGKEVYRYLRREHLSKIFERDNQGHAEMMNSIRKVWKLGLKDDATKMNNYIVERISSADATIKQFMEYLNEIEKDMISKGIPLPHPEDQYFSAMGIKQSNKGKS